MMKQIVKVSIAGCSFTLEQDACRVLDAYLKELKSHYNRMFGCDEIIEDIEERIAELIIEKGIRDQVVSVENVEEIIRIVGYPDDIDGGEKSGSGAGQSGTPRRKLYRDPEHRILGGVCSGLAAYLNTDILLVRILFILVFFGLSAWIGFASFVWGGRVGWFSLAMIVYIVMWAVVPEAKTVTQRCAMRGETPGIGDIQKNFRKEMKEGMGTVRKAGCGFLKIVGTILVKITGGLLTLAGVGGLIIGCLLFMGLEVFNGFPVLAIVDYVRMDVSPIWIKIFGLATYFLPFIGMLYAGIQLLFRFKSPKFRPGLIIFITWIISLICMSIFAARAFRPYYDRYEEAVAKAPVNVCDTLYIKYAGLPGNEDAQMYVEAGYSYFNLAFVDKPEENRGLKFTVYPKLEVFPVNDTSVSYVECRMWTSSSLPIRRWGESKKRAILEKTVSVRDSLVTISPTVYDRQNKFDGQKTSLQLFVPDNTVVIVTDPITHTFGESHYLNRTVRWGGIFW